MSDDIPTPATTVGALPIYIYDIKKDNNIRSIEMQYKTADKVTSYDIL